jgi:DNA polymerase sigma
MPDSPTYLSKWNRDFLNVLESQLNKYLDFLEPTDREKALRYWILHRIRRAVHDQVLFPRGYSMHEFGSFATGHYLSHGDIDLNFSVDSSNEMTETKVLELLQDMVRGEAWVSYSSVQLILDAKVPVLKFKAKKWMGGIAVDVVVGHSSGMESSQLVTQWCHTHTYFRHLVLIFKEWLRNHGYDVVYQGGLGGFSLMNLLVLVFSTYPSIADSDYPLAQYLILFFLVIGQKLDTTKYAVAISRGTLVRKEILSKEFQSFLYPNRLVIIDPSDSSNNVAKSSFRFSILVFDLIDTFKVIEKSQAKFLERGMIPVLDSILQTSRKEIQEKREKSEMAMWTIERVYNGLNLSIYRQSHLAQIDAFLKPSSDDFYDHERNVELDSSSSEEEMDSS